jgi:alpha-glucosidase
MTRLGNLLFLLAALTFGNSADALSIASPDGNITFSLSFNERAEARYTVQRGSETVIDDARLGLRFLAHPPFDTGLKLIAHQRDDHNQKWEQPWGERRWVRNHYRELLIELESDDGAGRRIDLRVRVFDDGLGFRYEVPAQDGYDEVSIVDEITEFVLPRGTRAWWIPARRYNRYEYLYREGDLSEVETAHTPITLRTPGGTYLSLHEAALVDYPGYVIDQRRDYELRTNLTPASDGIRARKKTPFHTPWRTLQIAGQAIGLVDSDLILNLNEPNRLGDVSWVEPGKYVGIWWSLHRDQETWGSGPRHGATTENTIRYMDFAAEHGFAGVLVEGWNIGWDGDWFHNGSLFRFAEAYADFDIEAVAEHGRETGVRLVGHHETSGDVSNYEAQMTAAFEMYERLGVRQVKTGYVADAGDIRRTDEKGLTRHEWHDSQFMVNHYLHNVREASKHRLSINTHEPIKDTGLRRTYPNWIAREGARGQEYNAWGDPPNPPDHVPTLVFTRMLSGPMDFTPGIFELQFERQGVQRVIESTLARQLALYVVIYSPIQMAADLPENYEARPEAFQFIKDVPTDWEQSIALAGEIDDFVAIARQVRGGRDWFLGAVTDEEARELSLSLDFLQSGRTYTMEVYRDGPEANGKTAPYDIVIEQRQVTAEDVLTLRLAPAGGAAVRLAPTGE